MDDHVDLDAILPMGLGQLTRPFGTAPVDPATGALSLQRAQQRIMAANRFGIPALAHEECLAGFATWGATAYPVPLSWGASFDPDLVREMGRRIGDDMRSVGVHQGLAPVLDVVRDLARQGMTMMLVTHEMRFAREVADRVVFMDGGVVVEAGPPEEIFTRPKSPRLQKFLKAVLEQVSEA